MGGLMKRKKVGSFGIIPTSKTGAINRSHDPAWLTKEDRDTEGVPSAGSSKFSIKVYCHRDRVIVWLWATSICCNLMEWACDSFTLCAEAKEKIGPFNKARIPSWIGKGEFPSMINSLTIHGKTWREDWMQSFKNGSQVGGQMEDLWTMFFPVGRRWRLSIFEMQSMRKGVSCWNL